MNEEASLCVVVVVMSVVRVCPQALANGGSRAVENENWPIRELQKKSRCE